MSMSRKPEDGLSQRKAERFRKAFRGYCNAYGATNADVGNALDTHAALRGRWAEEEAPKAVANAMLTMRKLTHRMVRRLVVALLLSEPALDSMEKLAVDPVPDEAIDLLSELGALDRDNAPYPAAFILPRACSALARNLAESGAQAAGIRKRRDELAKGIAKRLLDDVVPMTRAFCDALEHAKAKQASTVNDSLALTLFGDAYTLSRIAPSAWGPEFALLCRERPELALRFGIVVESSDMSEETRKRLSRLKPDPESMRIFENIARAQAPKKRRRP
ncbi:MAG: hypothetical protein ACYC8W_04665 [Candidatus Tyrphobacter sp.]